MTKAAVKNEISAEDKLFNRNKWVFSVSGIGRDMSYQLIAAFLLTYIQFGVTLTAMQFMTISLLIGVLGRVWDAINDPMMGAIIEGTHMKFGKFRPWILIGALATGVIIVVMFNVQSLSGWAFVVFMTVMYLLWESAFTMNDIGYWSMLASLSSKKEQRNSATMLTVVFAGIGAFVAQGGISFLYPNNVRSAFSWISIAVAAIFIAMQVVMVFMIKERPRSQMEVNEKISMKQMWDTIKKNDQVLWMTLSMLFYNIGSGLLVGLAYNLYYLEIGYDGNAIVFIAIFGVFNVGAQVFYPMIAKKLGRKKLQFWSILLACVGYAGIALLGWTKILPFTLWSLSLFGVMVFVGQALFYMSCIINMTNCVEYNEYKRGERNEAVVSTLRPFMAKFAEAVKYGIVTLILIASSVYGLSQNISTLETQKGHFDRMETVAAQSDYINQVYHYYEMLGVDADGNVTANIDLADLTQQMENDSVLAGKQINGEYLKAIGDAAVFEKKLDANGKVVKDSKGNDILIFIGFIKNAKTDISLQDGHKYIMVLSGTVTDAEGKPVLNANNEEISFNAANDNFFAIADKKENWGMRIWVRAGVSVVPILFIVAALIIQQKKFIIDEDYYDMMLAEIAKRRGDGGEQPAEGGPEGEQPAELPADDAVTTELPKEDSEAGKVPPDEGGED